MITRRELALSVASAALAIGLNARRTHAAEFQLRIGHDGAATSPMNLEMVKAAEIILKRTDGAVSVSVFPSSQLGAGSEMISLVRNGAVDGYLFAASLLGNISPSAGISALGYAFRSYESAWRALDGKMGDIIRQDLRGVGLVPMDKIWDIGMRNIATHTVPVRTVNDLKGLKIRVAVSPVNVSLWRALGAAPTAMNFSEIYSALQTRLIDGMEGPVSFHLTAKFFEVTKYYSLTGHQWEGLWLTMNPGIWQRLGKYQNAVQEELNQGAERVRVATVESDKQGIQELEQKGMTILRPNQKEFAEKLLEANYYAAWKGKYTEALWTEFERVRSG